jgi:GNAT superfamily N-acetyltransferase
MPDVTARAVALDDILRLRDLYRHEMHAQIVHDSHHRRGFTAPYLLERGGETVGYGCVGEYDTKGRDIIAELYVVPRFRGEALALLRTLIETVGATRVRAQSNDPILAPLLYDVCRPDTIVSDTLLFEDDGDRNLPAPPGTSARVLTESEKASVFEHHSEPVGDVAVEIGGKIVGTGGFLCHYNPPYGDVYMEVDAAHRGKGIGSYLVQAVKRAAYADGRLPAARCNADNHASRATLLRAGMRLCGRILTGTVAG